MRFYRRAILIIGSLIVVLSFQNCGDFSLQDEILFEGALMDSQVLVDADAFPRLLETASLTRWYKTAQPNFINETMVGDQYSVIIAVKRTYSGEVLELHDGAGQNAATLSVVGGKVRAARSDATGGWEEYKESSLPSSGEYMVIAATFGSEAGSIELLVNGMVEQADPVTATGSPANYDYLSKTLTVTATTSDYLEYMIYTSDADDEVLDGKELNALARYIGTNNTIAGIRFDPSLVGGPTTPTTPTDESPNFPIAKAIFDGQCLRCHGVSGPYAPNLQDLTEAKAVDQGWVIPGNAIGSMLYNTLKGSKGNGDKDMPFDTNISAGDVQAIETWINEM